MHPQHEETDGFTVVVLQHVANGEEIAQRLGHLLVVDVEKAVVQPVIDKRLTGGPFALRDLVFMMRELQIESAAVDVEMLAQQRATHGRALNVPARTTCAERRLVLGVRRLFRLGRLPEDEIQRIQLAIVDRHTLTCAQLVKRLTRELSVAFKLAHGVVHVTVGCPIGQTLVLQFANEVEHLPNVLCGTRLVRRRLDTQRSDVFMHGAGHLVGQLPNGDASLDRTTNDLVVDVGDVPNVSHPIARHLQPTLDHIEGHHHARMTDMAEVVNGHAADVHADLPGRQGHKRLDLTRQAVKKTQTHEKEGIGGSGRPVKGRARDDQKRRISRQNHSDTICRV